MRACLCFAVKAFWMVCLPTYCLVFQCKVIMHEAPDLPKPKAWRFTIATKPIHQKELVELEDSVPLPYINKDHVCCMIP